MLMRKIGFIFMGACVYSGVALSMNMPTRPEAQLYRTTISVVPGRRIGLSNRIIMNCQPVARVQLVDRTAIQPRPAVREDRSGAQGAFEKKYELLAAKFGLRNPEQGQDSYDIPAVKAQCLTIKAVDSNEKCLVVRKIATRENIQLRKRHAIDLAAWRSSFKKKESAPIHVENAPAQVNFKKKSLTFAFIPCEKKLIETQYELLDDADSYRRSDKKMHVAKK